MTVRCLALVLAMLTAPVAAQTLRMAVPADPSSIDPHFQDLGPNANIGKHVFDALIGTGAQSELRPGLATEWHFTADPTVMDVTLREGVRFHDGSPFTAEDVVFSLKRSQAIPNAPATVGRYVKDIADITIVSPTHLLFRTREPTPALANNLSNIPIVPARIGLAAEPKDFNSGQLAIGTGPYRFAGWTPGAEVRLVANPDWWGGHVNWPEVVIRTIPNNGARVAALLAGDVDLITAVPTIDAPHLRLNTALHVWQVVSNRDVFWAIDSGRETTPFVSAKDGGPIANPFRDPRVRQAVMLAINRRIIVDRVMEGLAVPSTQLVPPGMTGFDPSITLPDADPARARALLAEAGYPNGFKLTLHTTVGRYPNDQQQAEAVAQMLSRVGIQTEVASLPVAIFFVQARKHAFSFNLVSWGFGTGDTYVLVRETLHSKGVENYGGYGNAEVDRVLDLARTETDATRRGALIAAAQRVAVADGAFVPTHDQVNLTATRGLVLTPRMDEMTLAQDIVKSP